MDLAETAGSLLPYDVVTVGRTGVDIYPLQVGVGLEDVETFGKFLGGTAANVAVAAARHGLRTALISRTGDDPFGRFVHKALRQLGVDDRFVTPVPDLPTPVTFCEIFPPDDFPIYFYRRPAAPDMRLTAAQMDPDAVRDARIFWTTVSALSEEPSRSAHHAAWALRGGADRAASGGGADRAASGGGADRAVSGGGADTAAAGRSKHTILDLDYRPMFWSSREAAREQVGRALEHVTVAVGNLDECYTAVGERDPLRAADALLDRGVGLAVVKQGPKGVLARTRERLVEVPPVRVQVVNGLGAGDAFGGALCRGLLSGWPLERVLRFANVAGAIVASRLECSTAMPTTDEVEAVVAATADGSAVKGEAVRA